MNRCIAAALLAIGLSTATQAAETIGIDWGKAQRFELQRRVEAGQTLEVCGPLLRGQGVEWQFVASHPLAFNIHRHVGKQAIYAQRRQRTKSLTMRFVPEDAADYCWMWTAPPGEAVQLQVLMRY